MMFIKRRKEKYGTPTNVLTRFIQTKQKIKRNEKSEE